MRGITVRAYFYFQVNPLSRFGQTPFKIQFKLSLHEYNFSKIPISSIIFRVSTHGFLQFSLHVPRYKASKYSRMNSNVFPL